jgi:short-subunit dehydrogenase
MKKTIEYWKKIFSKVDDEVEVVRIEQNENKTNIKVIYLMPYSTQEEEFSFDMNLDTKDVINKFCVSVKERSNEMIFHIKECANAVEDMFD